VSLVKLLLGVGEPLYRRMLNYDGLSETWEETKIEKTQNCAVHENAETRKNGEFYWNGGK